ncbi:MAG: hypothetical protein WCQ21_15945 [Verrucomicrobiota bacterium]
MSAILRHLAELLKSAHLALLAGRSRQRLRLRAYSRQRMEKR